MLQMNPLKKVLDNTPKSVYNILNKDGEGFDLSSIPYGGIHNKQPLSSTLWYYYEKVKDVYEKNPSFFNNPPIFAGGYFRDIAWKREWPNDLDLFFNSYGMETSEAEDNLCLFMSELDLPFTEINKAEYAGINPMRIFDIFTLEPRVRTKLQIILKDLGPPSDDPLYVVSDFHYNHGKAALSVKGPAEVHYHGHAIAGLEHKIHVQYRERGFIKCFASLGSADFKQVDYTKNLLDQVKEKTEERAKDLEKLRSKIPGWWPL